MRVIFNQIVMQKRLSAIQNHIDMECIRRMKPYVPVASSRFRNAGKMRDAHKIASPGVIINTEPKARREYYINKGGSGGLRGKFWFERMKHDQKAEILKGLKP